jgi:hypothetical protein
MAKYNRATVKRITDLISQDNYTVDEICSLSGIHPDTYYDWIQKKPEFSEAVSRARVRYDDLIVKEAKNSLLKKIKGYTVQETRTVMVDSGKPGPDGKSAPKIRERIITERYIPADTQMIMLVLTNKVPEEYKNRHTTELTGKDGKELLPARVLTKKEARELIEKLESDS